MQIGTRLFLSFAVMALLLSVAGYISFSQVSKVGKSFDEVQYVSTPSIIALGNIKSDFNQLVATVLAFNLHPSEEHMEEIENTKAQLLQSYDEYKVIEQDKAAADTIGENINTILALGDQMVIAKSVSATTGTEDHDAMMAEEEHSAVQHSAGHEDHMVSEEGASTSTEGTDNLMMAAASTDEDIEHLHMLLLEFDEHSMMFRDELDMKIDSNYASLQATQGTVLGDIEKSIDLTVILTVAALSLVIGIGGFTAYSISKRVTQLKIVANRISGGMLQEQITTAGSDEIADLACNFEDMRKTLVNMQEELKSRNNELEDVNLALKIANEELKKLDKLKDEFIGIASHELRGPIHPILGYAAMAKEGKISPQGALDIITKQAMRLRQLADDILDVSRIESGTLSYNMQKMKIHETISNCLVACRPNLDSNQVSIISKVDRADKDVEIVADKDRITQVLVNIIGNAVKFTKKGNITVETHLNKDGNRFEIIVSDTGDGIPKEILPRLFGKFVTQNIGDSNRHGTGLGLFISKAIVTAHGGEILAHNNDFGGATFKIILPVGTDTAHASSKSSLRMEKPSASDDKKKPLISQIQMQKSSV